MASIRRLPSGKFQATVRHPSGKRITKTDAMRRAVKAWADDLEQQLRLGAVTDPTAGRTTLAAWHARWLATRMVEASTARKDADLWRNHVGPYWGTWPVEAIQREDVQKWVKLLVDRSTGSSAIHGAHGLLSTILSAAVDARLIAATPCRRITLPRLARPEPRWLTRHEYDRLQLALGELMTVRGGRARVPDPHAPVYQALVGLGAFAGLRPAELAGLDVGAVDLDRQLVRVTQVVTQVPDGLREDGRTKYRFAVRPYPKSDRSVRSVPFPDEVAELLWRILADRTSGPVFTGPQGGRVHMVGNFPRAAWRPALKAAGIEPVRPYVLRHTCASWLVQAGVPDRQIMAILGHADTHLIDVYAHLAPDRHDAVRAAWGRMAEGSRRWDDARTPDGVNLADRFSRSEGSFPPGLFR